MCQVTIFKVLIDKVFCGDRAKIVNIWKSGDSKSNSTYIEWGVPDGFFGGNALIKADKAQKQVFTGDEMPLDEAKKTEWEVLKNYAISNGIPFDELRNESCRK